MSGMDWPLIGREAETAYCLGRFEIGRGVVLAGRAGVGKSRLARELIAELSGDHRVVAATATLAGRTIPYGAFTHLGSEAFDPTRFMAELTDQQRPDGVVFFVDDANLLDDRGAAFVLALQQRGVRIVLTVRSGRECPDAIRVLWKDGFLDRVELAPLSRTEVGTLLGEVLGGPVVPSALDRMFDATEGNPLFLRHLVIAALERGDLVDDGGTWHWRGRAVVDTSLGDLIRSEIGLLGAPVGRLLGLVAFAEPVEYGFLARAASDRSIREALDRGLVALETHAQRAVVRFAHPLYGEYVRDQATPGEQRSYCRALADAAASFPQRRSSDELRRTVWLLDSGGCDDLELLFRAGLVARRYLDSALVERLSNAGIALGGGFDFILGHALAHRFRAEFAEATALYEQLWAMTVDDGERMFMLNAQLLMTFFPMGQETEAIGLLRRRAAAIDNPAGKLLASGLEAVFLASSGDRTHARTTAEHALSEYERLVAQSDSDRVILSYRRPGLTPIADARALATCARTLIGLVEGDTASGMDFAAAAREMAFACSNPTYWFLADFLAERAERLWGDRLASSARANELAALARQYTSSAGAAGATALLSSVAALGRGRLHEALVHTADAREGLACEDFGNFMFHVANVETVGSAMLGDGARARTALMDAEARFRPNVAAFEPDLVIARAWTAWVNGQGHEAECLLRAESDQARADGRWGDALELDHEGVRLGDATAVDRVLDSCSHVAGPLSDARARHAAGHRSGDAVELISAGDMFENVGADLLALDAFAHAVVAGERQSLRSRVQEAGARMRELQSRCEGARTPALLSADAPPALTRREAEIARLVTEGLSNQAIADHLVVSRRTVESHLARTFTKLGVKSRDEVARAMGTER